MSTYTILYLKGFTMIYQLTSLLRARAQGSNPYRLFSPPTWCSSLPIVTSLIVKMMNIHNFVHNLNLKKLAANEHGI